MSSFEWMELETLNSEIAHAQTRLAAARSAKNHILMQLLEREIAEAAERRDQVLASITQGFGPSRQGVPNSSQDPAETEDREPQPPKPVKRAASVSGSVPPAPAPASPRSIEESIKTEGLAAMWDRLSVGDIEQVKRGLTQRRAELLARHAEELKALEAEQAEIDNIERSIAAFARKFNLAAGGQIVPLDVERSPVQAG